MQLSSTTRPRGIWNELLDIARWAPSPHNTQPWKLHPVNEMQADLFLVVARTLPDEDTTGSFIRCAMGMFIEALAIAAAHRGLHLLAERPIAAAQDGLIPFARLSVHADPSVKDDLTPEDVLGRRTARLSPGPRQVSEQTLKQVKNAAGENLINLSWTSDSRLISQIMKINMTAMCHDLNEDKYHAEICKWFRYGKAHANRTNDGLEARCMNMPAHELYLTATFPTLLVSPLTARLMQILYSRRLGTVNQLGFLSGEFFESPDVSSLAGRALMRLWLHLHRAGIGIHPFGNLVTNSAAHSQLTNLMKREKIWLVFRLGHTALPPRSLRLPQESILC